MFYLHNRCIALNNKKLQSEIYHKMYLSHNISYKHD